MRTYSLLVLALVALGARAASIPTPPEAQKKLPPINNALDDVSLDNNDSEQELIDQSNTVKDVENNLRNCVPENVPVKIVEEQPVIKTIALKEDSNDYVPDNDDSLNIKRFEIDLKNPGPPQRQEHDSQNPTYYVDNQRTIAAIKLSIERSEDTFKNGIHDVSNDLDNFFANKEELSTVQQNIKHLRQNFNEQVTKLNDKINSFLTSDAFKVKSADVQKDSLVKDVENSLKNLDVKFNTGIDMLNEGVEMLSILKEEDEKEKSYKISGKADTENVAEGPSNPTVPVQPSPGSGTTGTSTAAPTTPNIITSLFQSFQNTMTEALNNVGNTFQNFINPNQNQNQNTDTNVNIFPNFNFPNVFQGQNQGQSQNQQSTTPPGVQADEASTEKPNIIQQLQNNFQNFIAPQQNTQQQQTQNQNPFIAAIQSSPIFQGISQGINSIIRPQQSNQQTSQATNVVVNQADAAAPAVPVQTSNSVPAAAAVPAPAKESAAEPAPAQGPIQQIVQNSPIVQGITHTVQRIQGLSNPSKPRDAAENVDTKGHRPGTGDNNNSDRVEVKDVVMDEPGVVEEIKIKEEPVAELNKTE